MSEAVESLYGWDDGTISIMSNWGPISYSESSPSELLVVPRDLELLAGG